MEQNDNHTMKIIKIVFIALLMISGFALIVFYIEYFLLLFAGVLFSVLLNYSANWIAKFLKIKYGYALVIVMLLIVGSASIITIFVGNSIVDQVNQMAIAFPKALKNLTDMISQTSIGQKLLNEIPENPSDLISNKREAIWQVVGSFSTTFGAIADFFIILVIGAFLAADPKTYVKGFVSLFPIEFRPRLVEVMDKIHETLSLWMTAKLFSMTIVGITTGIGLQILGIPLPYALALIVALFSFIPNIGPLLALAPAIIIAFSVGLDKVLYVVILYLGVEMLESYLITPFFEKKMVALPPALTITWMVFCGITAGIFGLILATPILASVIVIISELYVKDQLENRIVVKH